jgi:acyl-CoA synthetase (AMP-forming)/AMP-acid ligase II
MHAMPPGPFVTSDAADALADGALEIRGRIDEAIVTGGLVVHPEDIERAAMSVPGVAVACAVGVPSELYGDVVVLLCEAEPGAHDLARAVDGALRAALPATHLPKEVRFVPRVPRSPTGKALRREAKRIALEP